MSDRIVVMRSGRIEQIGTPRDIYRHPKDRFVAEFIGETNLFPVTVDRIDGATALTRTAEGVPLLLPATGRKPGDSADRDPAARRFHSGRRWHSRHRHPRGLSWRQTSIFSSSRRPGGPKSGSRPRRSGVGEGATVHLAHDPARVHVLEGA